MMRQFIFFNRNKKDIVACGNNNKMKTNILETKKQCFYTISDSLFYALDVIATISLEEKY